MSKSTGSRLRGRTSRTGTVTVIEAPVSANFRRRARITFFVVAGVTGLLAATIESHTMSPVAGIFLGAVIGIVIAAPVAAVVFMWPVLRVFLWWSGEIAATVTAVWLWQLLMTATPLWLSVLVVALVAGGPAAVPSIRRRIVPIVWCAVVRHRLRVAFNAFIISNRQGSLPLILIARPTRAGERVWVWLRPGLSLTDLEGRADKLAVTCWAKDTRIAPASHRYAALVRVDITRRDPLTDLIASPLPGLLPDFTADAVAPTSPGMPPLALDLPDVPAPAAHVQQRRSPTLLPRNAPAPTDDAPYGSNNADWA